MLSIKGYCCYNVTPPVILYKFFDCHGYLYIFDCEFMVILHPELQHKPVLVDLTVEEGTRLKVLYGSELY